MINYLVICPPWNTGVWMLFAVASHLNATHSSQILPLFTDDLLRMRRKIWGGTI